MQFTRPLSAAACAWALNLTFTQTYISALFHRATGSQKIAKGLWADCGATRAKLDLYTFRLQWRPVLQTVIKILISILCQLCSQVIQIWQRMAALNFSYIHRKEKTEDKSSNALAWRARAVLINKRIFSVITALPSLLQCLLRLSQQQKETWGARPRSR